MANLSNINNKFLVTTGGNVLIGKTAANNATVGTQIMSAGDINSTVSGDTVARFNRLSNDGEIIRIQKDTNTVGYIGSNTAGGDPLLDIGSNSSGDSLMRFLTSGSERIRIDKDGNVGIGATSIYPQGNDTILKLYSTSIPRFYLQNTTTGSNTTDGSQIYVSGSDLYITNSESANTIFSTNSLERMRLTGTNMSGGWDETARLYGDYPVLTFNSTAASKMAGIGYDSSFGMRVWLNAGSTDVTATTALVSIDNAGNVGIGTVSPERVLHLDANQGQAIIQLDKGGDKIISIGTGSSATNADDTILQMFNEGSELVRIFTEGNSWFNGGNVGIGTVSPTGNLTVQSIVNINDGSNFTNKIAPLVIGDINGVSNSRVLLLDSNQIESNGDSLYLNYNSAQNVILGIGGGNVGIFTTTPGAKLEINAQGGGVGGYTGFKMKYGTSSVQSLYIGQVTAGNGVFIGTAQYRNGGYWQTEGTASSVISMDAAGNIRFSTNSGLTANTDFNISHRMSVLTNGELVLGSNSTTTISTDAIHSLGNVNRPGLTSAMHARLVMQERTGNWISFVNGTPTHFGTIAVSGSGVSYGSNSDYRLKENILDLTNSINKVKLLSPKTFNFIDRPDTTVTGFLAHEVQEIVSEAVTGEKDGTITTGNVINDSDGTILEQNITEPEKLETGTSFTAIKTEPEYQQIDQAKLVPVLIGALKELIAKVEKLENK
jgi:hypothetical protein